MSIYKNLLTAKKEMEAITKDSKNPFFKSNYFDVNKILSEVEPILQKNGLLLLQPIEAEWVKSVIINVEDGEKVSSEMHLPNLTDPQKIGSAITYYRRYTLQSLLGLQAEDDDGNLASKKNETVRKPALTNSQFEAAKQGTKKQTINVLNKYRMSGSEREELSRCLKTAKDE